MGVVENVSGGEEIMAAVQSGSKKLVFVESVVRGWGAGELQQRMGKVTQDGLQSFYRSVSVFCFCEILYVCPQRLRVIL